MRRAFVGKSDYTSYLPHLPLHPTASRLEAAPPVSRLCSSCRHVVVVAVVCATTAGTGEAVFRRYVASLTAFFTADLTFAASAEGELVGVGVVLSNGVEDVADADS